MTEEETGGLGPEEELLDEIESRVPEVLVIHHHNNRENARRVRVGPQIHVIFPPPLCESEGNGETPGLCVEENAAVFSMRP